MKYFIFSIDDGTIYDQRVIEMFNKYHIKATFNLNSGLGDFVWYKDGHPIRRFILNDHIYLYEGHEVASHSLTHPHLTECPSEIIVKEVGEDITNLERIFSRTINTFAFPFSDSDERCINIIKHIHNVKCIRLSDIDTSYRFPFDQYHIKITSLNIYDALNRINEFINDKEAQLFTFVSHAYDFELSNSYDKLEEFCQIVTKQKDIKIITMSELDKIMKNDSN